MLFVFEEHALGTTQEHKPPPGVGARSHSPSSCPNGGAEFHSASSFQLLLLAGAPPITPSGVTPSRFTPPCASRPESERKKPGVGSRNPTPGQSATPIGGKRPSQHPARRFHPGRAAMGRLGTKRSGPSRDPMRFPSGVLPTRRAPHRPGPSSSQRRTHLLTLLPHHPPTACSNPGVRPPPRNGRVHPEANQLVHTVGRDHTDRSQIQPQSGLGPCRRSGVGTRPGPTRTIRPPKEAVPAESEIRRQSSPHPSK